MNGERMAKTMNVMVDLQVSVEGMRERGETDLRAVLHHVKEARDRIAAVLAEDLS